MDRTGTRIEAAPQDAEGTRDTDDGERDEEDRGWLFDEQREQVLNLVAAVDSAVPSQGGRTVVFMAAVPEAGTTSVAWAYARAAHLVFNRRTLVLDALPRNGWNKVPPAGRHEVTHMPTAVSLYPGQRGSDPLRSIVSWHLVPQHGGTTEEVLATASDPDFWKRLRGMFDYVVVDAPPLSVSYVGMSLARYADGVVLVVDGERSRIPVVEKLAEDLRRFGSNVVGTVFNKRRFYVPERIYKRL